STSTSPCFTGWLSSTSTRSTVPGTREETAVMYPSTWASSVSSNLRACSHQSRAATATSARPTPIRTLAPGFLVRSVCSCSPGTWPPSPCGVSSACGSDIPVDSPEQPAHRLLPEVGPAKEAKVSDRLSRRPDGALLLARALVQRQ